ncbi:DUF2202 domain-containing protein [Candidatus Nomurabacteria bacterium]|nr:DUF2202 domain-containing protein [Candidatus Kaiserbacteria bacterium]MCB9815213.1 DUF2202 domain-containing protein [Candidatus Nomurabacteria bacterium]
MVAVGFWSYSASEKDFSLQQKVETAPVVVSETDELDNYQVAEIDYVDAVSLLGTEASDLLTPAEINGLVFMREEEKLARDVYLALYDKWGVNIFNNISASEQTHTGAVLTLLQRYGIADPASTERGVFSDVTLQDLYNQLIAEGFESKIGAFMVGAKIEDLDIRDLSINLAKTENYDIKTVYQSLQRSSRNHLRAFNRQLLNETGSNYDPEFISQADFDAIISSDVERGSAQKQGGGQVKGRN